MLFESLEVKVGEGSSKPMKGEVEEKKTLLFAKKKKYLRNMYQIRMVGKWSLGNRDTNN